MKLVHNIWKTDGLKGFYRGLTATYVGVTETVIHFVIYEHLKKLFKERRENYQMQPLDCVLAAGLAKMTASSTCYPHGEWTDLVPTTYTVPLDLDCVYGHCGVNIDSR